MFAFLRGTVHQVVGDAAVLLVGGVGYEIHPTHPESLPVGQTAEVWISTVVREDAIQLYAFESVAEKEVFHSLLKVNGIGPKLANKVLGACPWEQLLEIIDAGDVQRLTALPKVGRKTAEQILVELRGKVRDLARPGGGARGGSRSEITSALVHLGYRLVDVERVVREMPAEMGLEQGVREGLQKLSQI